MADCIPSDRAMQASQNLANMPVGWKVRRVPARKVQAGHSKSHRVRVKHAASKPCGPWTPRVQLAEAQPEAMQAVSLLQPSLSEAHLRQKSNFGKIRSPGPKFTGGNRRKMRRRHAA